MSVKPFTVLAFRAFYTRQIGLQVISGGSGRDFALYIGVLPPDVRHADYEQESAMGKGMEIPEGEKMSYTDAKAVWGGIIERFERQGLLYRN